MAEYTAEAGFGGTEHRALVRATCGAARIALRTVELDLPLLDAADCWARSATSREVAAADIHAAYESVASARGEAEIAALRSAIRAAETAVYDFDPECSTEDIIAAINGTAIEAAHYAADAVVYASGVAVVSAQREVIDAAIEIGHSLLVQPVGGEDRARVTAAGERLCASLEES